MHPNPFGLALSLSPVDLPEPLVAPPHPLRWTSTVIAVATLVLALFNAHAIRGWAYQLPEGEWSERTVLATEGWYEIAGTAGLNRPVESMHGYWEELRTRRFGTETAAPASAAEAQ